MEKLVLCLYLAGYELDIVYQHQIGLPVLGAEVAGLAGADGFDKIIDELVALDIEDPGGGILLMDDVGNGVEQMGLAQARTAIDEQGVVVLARRVGHGAGGGAGQLVGGAYHEGLKGELAAVHDGSGLVFLGVLPCPESLVVKEAHGHIGGKNILQTGLDVGKEAVLDIGALEIVGTVEDQLVTSRAMTVVSSNQVLMVVSDRSSRSLSRIMDQMSETDCIEALPFFFSLGSISLFRTGARFVYLVYYIKIWQ